MKPNLNATNLFDAMLDAPQREALDVISAAIFLLAVVLGMVAGYPVAPSVVVALAATYLVQMTCLTAVIFLSDRPSAGAMVDRWLGLDIADLWTVRPDSDDAPMHLELGTLSAGHLASPAQGEGKSPEDDADTPTWQPIRPLSESAGQSGRETVGARNCQCR